MFIIRGSHFALLSSGDISLLRDMDQQRLLMVTNYFAVCWPRKEKQSKLWTLEHKSSAKKVKIIQSCIKIVQKWWIYCGSPCTNINFFNETLLLFDSKQYTTGHWQFFLNQSSMHRKFIQWIPSNNYINKSAKRFHF